MARRISDDVSSPNQADAAGLRSRTRDSAGRGQPSGPICWPYPASMRRWNEAEYDVLFRDHPPTRPNAPDLATSRAIARTIRRTPDAVIAHWDDARSAVLGSSTLADRGD